MPMPEYSNDAINVIAKFYKADEILFVEGEDDILFWRTVSEKCSSIKFQIQMVGGACEVDKYIAKIVNSEISSYAARDRDYLEFQGKLISHPKVFYTYGANIENSLHEPQAAKRMINFLCRLDDPKFEFLGPIFDEAVQSLESILVHEIASNVYALDISVAGKSCKRFFEKDKTKPSQTKIADALLPVQKALSDSQIDLIAATIAASGKGVLELINGHFLCSLLIHITQCISSLKGKKTILSNDAMYAHSIGIFELGFENHPHSGYYKSLFASE